MVELPVAEEPVIPEAAPAQPRSMTDAGSAPDSSVLTTTRTIRLAGVQDGLTRQIKLNRSKIRMLPTEDSKIVGELSKGDTIKPTGRTIDLRGAEFGDWYRIEEPKIGYVRFGNTSPPAKAATRPAAKVEPVSADLQVMTTLKLFIRKEPSDESDKARSQTLALGTTVTPVGIADDTGGNPGKQWSQIKKPVTGFIAAWHTQDVQQPSPTVRSSAPAAQGGASDRAQSNSTRGLDAVRGLDAIRHPSGSPYMHGRRF